MSERQALVKGLNQAVPGKHACIAELVGTKFIRIWSVITSAMSESEGTVSKAICNLLDSFPVQASSDGPGPSADRSSDQAHVLFIV